MPIDEEIILAAIQAVADKQYDSIASFARERGMAPRTLQENIQKYRNRAEETSSIGDMRRASIRGEIGGPRIPDAGKPTEGFVIRRNSGQYNAAGDLERQWIESGQGTADGYEVPEGHTVKGESTLLDANGNVLVKWVKTRKDDAVEGLIEGLKAAFAQYDGAAPVIPAPKHAETDILTVYPLPDVHFGMRSWKEETGADYDASIASHLINDSTGTLVGQSRPSEHAVVLLLGDFYHQNDQKNATPGSGHQLDVDGRWPRVYLAGAKMAISIVDRVARKHKNVEVIVLPGNHDSDAAPTLAVALALFYSQTSRVAVNLTPGVTWYRRFGQNLFGANHGHTIRTAEKMAMAMAVDQYENWGRTKHRFIWTGHLHHEILKEIAGVRVETLNSPAARDAWNAASGYRSNRALQAITVHSEHGEIGRHRVNISGAAA